ncbi:hypothetical protein ACRBEV_04120 [Methylobacterium phyllosphaerae]
MRPQHAEIDRLRKEGVRAASAANLLERQFAADGPNRKWIADFTYIWLSPVEFENRAKLA